MSAPKRRWLRFSLQTLFILTTVVACWLGWQVHVFQERKRVLATVESHLNRRQRALLGLPAEFVDSGSVLDCYQDRTSAPRRDVSLVRKWLGDQPRYELIVTSLEDAQNVARWFPEASIYIDPPADKLIGNLDPFSRPVKVDGALAP